MCHRAGYRKTHPQVSFSLDEIIRIGPNGIGYAISTLILPSDMLTIACTECVSSAITKLNPTLFSTVGPSQPKKELKLNERNVATSVLLKGTLLLLRGSTIKPVNTMSNVWT